jgi:fumarate reductase subunit D
MIQFSTAILFVLVLYSAMQVPFFLISDRLNEKTRDLIQLFIYFFIVLLVFVLYLATDCNRYTDFDRMRAEMQQAAVDGPTGLLISYGLNPLSGIFLYLIALTGYYSLLKGFAGALYWGLMFYLSWRLRGKMHGGSLYLGILFLLSFLNLTYPADSVRFPVACMLFCVGMCLYYFADERPLKIHLFCIIACLLHVSLWPFYLIFLFSKWIRGKLVYLMCFMLAGSFFLLEKFTSTISNFNPSLGWKMELYFNPDSQYYADIISKQQIGFMALGLLVSLVVVFLWRRWDSRLLDEKCSSVFATQFLISASLVIGSFPSNITFSRLVPIVFIMSMPCLVEIVSKRHTVARFEIVSVDAFRQKSFQLLFVFGAVVFMFVGFVLRLEFSYSPFYLSL